MSLAGGQDLRRPRVVAVGSLHQDLVIKADRLPRSGESLRGSELFTSPGGKGGNQAVAASRLGVPSAIVSRVGRDNVGADLRQRLDAEGVSSTFVQPTRGAPTGVAIIVVRPDGENMITFASGANGLLGPDDVAAAGDVIRGAEAVMLQLEVSVEASMAAMGLAHEAGAIVSLNAAPLPPSIGSELRELIAGVDILVMNELEACQLLDTDTIGTTVTDRKAAARALKDFGPRVAVITLAHEGGVAQYDDQVMLYDTIPVAAVDGVGAGDAFCAGLVIATIEGKDPAPALEWASACGGLAATGVGAQASLPLRRDVELQLELAGMTRSAKR